jgi:hypothetical protein
MPLFAAGGGRPGIYAGLAKCSVSKIDVRVFGMAWYNRSFGKETTASPWRGHVPCAAQPLFFARRFPRNSSNGREARFVVKRHPTSLFNDFDWRYLFTSIPNGIRNGSVLRWAYRGGKLFVGGNDGLREISPWTIVKGGGGRPIFPPLDRALVKALACERVAETGLPLSRQSLADLVPRAEAALSKSISRTTIGRILAEDAIKPWRYKYWIFPRDPRFLEKAGPILDLYAGTWGGSALGPKDYIISADEKTSIQARIRIHPSLGPGPQRQAWVESEYERGGALQYLAAWDVRRGYVMGRCEPTTGIAPFTRLVEQVLSQKPYRSARRLFWVVDNGSSHRGDTACQRMRKIDRRIILVHTPVHASWLNQVEIYFSIIQRKVLTPNDFPDLDAVRVRLGLYENLSNQNPCPFAWKFNRQKLVELLARIEAHRQLVANSQKMAA